jgi:hypothetical protein
VINGVIIGVINGMISGIKSSKNIKKGGTSYLLKTYSLDDMVMN